MENARSQALKEEIVLVRRMLAGDEVAMEAFGDVFFPGLYRFALSRLGGDGDLARDIVQTTVCKALGRLDSYRGEAPLWSWLCACCRNEIAMHFRRRHSFREVELDEGSGLEVGRLGGGRPGPEDRAISRETGDLVHQTLDGLPPHYARALEWKYVDRLPVKEIATRLRLGPKAAESLLTRARVAFKRAYDSRQAVSAPQARAGIANGRMGRS